MPTSFPQKDSDTGELVDVTYFYAAEVAPRLHVSVRTLERRCQNKQWPHLKVSGTYYFSADHVAAIVRLLTTDVDDVGPRTTQASDRPQTRRLGVVMDDDDLDGLGGVR